MVCSKCGNKNEDNALICIYCGSTLTNNGSINTDQVNNAVNNNQQVIQPSMNFVGMQVVNENNNQVNLQSENSLNSQIDVSNNANEDVNSNYADNQIYINNYTPSGNNQNGIQNLDSNINLDNQEGLQNSGLNVDNAPKGIDNVMINNLSDNNQIGSESIVNDHVENNDNSKKKSSVVVVVLCVLILCGIGVYIALNYDMIVNKVQKMFDNNEVSNDSEQGNNNDEFIITEDMKKEGTSQFGYVYVPNDWVRFVDPDAPDVFQVSLGNEYIVSLYKYDGVDGVSIYSYADSLKSQLEEKNIEVIVENDKIKDYDAIKLMYYEDNTWVYIWFLYAEDNCFHYIAIEGPDRESDFFKINESFTLE